MATHRSAFRRRRQAILERDVAPGVHRLQHASTNAYIVEDRGAVTLVDALFPKSRVHLDVEVAALADVEALDAG